MSECRIIFSGLLSELPEDAIVWRSDNDCYTAAAMRNQIESGTEIGRLYVADLLRISRDLLCRSALK